MPAAARGNGVDSVFSFSGSGYMCNFPMNTQTGQCSTNVLANGIGIVRQGDLVAPHARNGCYPDLSGLTTGSSRVLVNGRPAGRIGDVYTTDNIIVSGSYSVFMG